VGFDEAGVVGGVGLGSLEARHTAKKQGISKCDLYSLARRKGK
jgi:hypothetical protein